MPEWMKSAGAALTTVFVFAVLVWSLGYVFGSIGTAPVLDTNNKVVLDKFGNAKDILLVILPLATSAVGFWLGSQGTAAAKADAKDATAKKNALLAVADPATIAAAQAKNSKLLE